MRFLFKISSLRANVPHTHKVARLLPWQVVRAERYHLPEVGLLLASAQAADGKTGNITLGHL